jgi:predicted nucleic acid-binding protein
LSTYFDTSLLVGLFVDFDAFAKSARQIYIDAEDPLVVSDFAAAEFSSVIARLVRMDLVPEDEARAIFGRFDAWRTRSAQAAHVSGIDVQTANGFIRRLDLNVRAPDAINLAIARRFGASIATFDRRMSDNAQALGIRRLSVS